MAHAMALLRIFNGKISERTTQVVAPRLNEKLAIKTIRLINAKISIPLLCSKKPKLKTPKLIAITKEPTSKSTRLPILSITQTEKRVAKQLMTPTLREAKK